ncbi:MAG TPA: CBS domain-containing protein [Polyangiaceae bacterium]|nr:CBS domain-containing protein [Polyangiaceae bacterium]
MTTARDLMTKGPVTVSPRTTVRQAARLLYTLDVRHLPVVDEEGTLVGMLSDRDLRGVALPLDVDGEHVADRRAALDAPVATLMSGDVISVDLEDDAAVVVELMIDHRIGAIPVVDADGAVVGIVSYVDVLRELPLDAEAG